MNELKRVYVFIGDPATGKSELSNLLQNDVLRFEDRLLDNSDQILKLITDIEYAISHNVVRVFKFNPSKIVVITNSCNKELLTELLRMKFKHDLEISFVEFSKAKSSNDIMCFDYIDDIRQKCADNRGMQRRLDMLESELIRLNKLVKETKVTNDSKIK